MEQDPGRAQPEVIVRNIFFFGSLATLAMHIARLLGHGTEGQIPSDACLDKALRPWPLDLFTPLAMQ